MNVVKCPYCGTEHSEGTCFDACPHCHAPHQPSWAKFCNSCGSELTPTAPQPSDSVIATKRCPQCHTSGLPESAAFCSVCGYDFNARKESPRVLVTCIPIKNPQFSTNHRSFKARIYIGQSKEFELCEGVNTLRLSQYPWLSTKELTFSGGYGYQIEKIEIINSVLKNRLSFHFGGTSLDVSNIDTSDWESLSGCFEWSRNLRSLDLSSFNTHKVKTVHSCFYDCVYLAELNLSGWDLSNVVKTNSRESFFRGCFLLKRVIMRGCNDYTVDLVETALEEAGLNNVEIIR